MLKFKTIVFVKSILMSMIIWDNIRIYCFHVLKRFNPPTSCVKHMKKIHRVRDIHSRCSIVRNTSMKLISCSTNSTFVFEVMKTVMPWLYYLMIISCIARQAFSTCSIWLRYLTLTTKKLSVWNRLKGIFKDLHH